MKAHHDTQATKKTHDRAQSCWQKTQGLWDQAQRETKNKRIFLLLSQYLNKTETLFQDLAAQNFMNAADDLKQVVALKNTVLNYANYHQAKNLMEAAAHHNSSIHQLENSFNLYQKAVDLLTPLAAKDLYDSIQLLEQAGQKRIAARSLFVRAQADAQDALERARERAHFKSLEYQFRSIYRISGGMLPQFHNELKEAIEAQIRLYLCYPNLPQSNAYINRLLKKICKIGKDLPIYDIDGRKQYVSELEAEINTFNEIVEQQKEPSNWVKKYFQLDLLLEYNTHILELFNADQIEQEKTSAPFQAAYNYAYAAHDAFSRKIKEYHEKNNLLKDEKRKDPPQLEFRIQVEGVNSAPAHKI